VLFAAQTLRVDVDLVQTVATVTNPEGRLVTNLKAEDFIVEYDGVAQNIAHFTLGTDAPVSLALLIDTSGSMAGRLPTALEAASAFILGMKGRDEGLIMSFATDTKVHQSFTQSRSRLFKALAEINSIGGGTDLFAAVQSAAGKTRKGIHPKRALVVLSDGGQSTRRGSLTDFRADVRKTEALIYPIGITQEWAPDESWGEKVLDAIANETGGRRFTIRPDDNRKVLVQRFNDVFTQIMTELRGQYSIGFYPLTAARNAPGRIRVRTVDPAYRVRSRQ
jgi:Ca-activated chloride channel family protein